MNIRCRSSITCRRYAGTVAGILVLWNSVGLAGTVDGIDGTAGPGLGVVSGTWFYTLNPNNDNVANAAGDNGFGVDELIFDNPSPIDVQYSVAGSGGVTEYSVIESIFNFSPDTWIGIRLQLGFGTGANFRLAPESMGLDFDAPDLDPAPTSIIFPNAEVSSNSISWSGNEIPFGYVDAVFFAIDVPDGIDHFTLRHIPVIDVQTVAIDVDPRDADNVIVVGEERQILVAVLSTSLDDGDDVDFDANTILRRTLALGPAGATPSSRPRLRDIDNDGDVDLIANFTIADTGLDCDAMSISLAGSLRDGTKFIGSDVISLVGCGL